MNKDSPDSVLNIFEEVKTKADRVKNYTLLSKNIIVQHFQPNFGHCFLQFIQLVKKKKKNHPIGDEYCIMQLLLLVQD